MQYHNHHRSSSSSSSSSYHFHNHILRSRPLPLSFLYLTLTPTFEFELIAMAIVIRPMWTQNGRIWCFPLQWWNHLGAGRELFQHHHKRNMDCSFYKLMFSFCFSLKYFCPLFHFFTFFLSSNVIVKCSAVLRVLLSFFQSLHFMAPSKFSPVLYLPSHIKRWCIYILAPFNDIIQICLGLE